MNPSYYAGWLAFRAVFRCYFGWRVYGAERVPPEGPVVLAANHASYIDPPLIGAGLHRQVNFLARNTLFDQPVLGAVLRSWEVVPVDREGAGASGLKAILDRLRQGGAILLFPEGTRTSTGALQPARSGIGLAVLKSSCPVIPVRVFGTYQAYGRHLRLPRPFRVAVKFGLPMDFAAARAEAGAGSRVRLKALYQEVADQLMAAIAKLEPCTEVRQFPPPPGAHRPHWGAAAAEPGPRA
jgi:1-acyl-sn-glycerol-3-phosphate acyltransferase